MKHDPVGGGEACGGFFCSPENELGIFHVNMCERVRHWAWECVCMWHMNMYEGFGIWLWECL